MGARSSSLVPRLFVFALVLGGLRDPRLFAAAGAAAWAAVWRDPPALAAARAWLPWLCWAALSALVSVQPLAGLPVLARWGAVLACASLAASWDERRRLDWLKALLAAAGVLAVAALVTGAGRGMRNEMTGLIPPNSNYTAFVLAAAASAAAAWLLHPRGPSGTERSAVAASLALSLSCVWLARSRGAWLGLSAAAAAWSIRRWGARAAAGAALAAALLGGALAGGVLPGPVEEALLKKYRDHADARPALWRSAAGTATGSPWFGVGPGNFAVGYRRRPARFVDGAANWPMRTSYAHSEPLQAAAETGWAGLALWLLGAGAALGALLRGRDEEPARDAAAAAAAAMTAQLLADNMLQIPALAALWLCAAAAAGAPPTGRRWPRPAAAAGAALALASWIPGALAAGSPERAAALFPAEPGPREELAYRATSAGKAGEADGHWRAGQELDPFNAIYPWRRAQLAGASGRWEDCERLAGRAVELEPGFLNARLLRADALLRLSRAREARAEIAEIEARRASRDAAVPLSGYERTVVALEERELARVSAAASGRK